MVLDTVRLARRVFTKDEAPNVKLATLARICCTSVTPSHRALDDARATVYVLHTMLGRLGPLGVTHRDDLVTATDPVPPRRRKKAHLAEELPHTPGVYHFIGPGEEVMYVGTSVNVYKRVRQYFTAAESRKRMGEMVDLAVRVDAISTPTVLEAQILELRHIARYDPPYNRRSKRPARAPWLTLTDEAHPRLMVSRKLRMENANTSLGPFSSTVAARKAARLIADEAQLRTCTTVLPAVPLSSASPCHLLSLGKCDAPCVREPPPLSSAARAKDILSGSLDGVWEHQHERLALLAQAERFEQAAEERDRLAVVLNATKNKERFLPFLRASRILAARPAHSSHCWEIMLMQFGKLVGSAVTAPGERPPDVARALAEHVPESVEPEFVGQDASIEESRILLQWLWQEDTRLLEFTGPTPLALPRHSSSRFTLPVAQHGEESDSW